MKAIKLTAVIFFLCACGTKGKLISGKGGDTVPVSRSEKNPQAYIISGQVTKTRSYCGGARPPDELLADLATPRPYADKKFHVRKGDTNTLASPIVLSFTTDTAGKFSFQLPPGTYSIIQEEQGKEMDAKKYKSETIKADEECLKEWWAKPYYVLEVKSTDIKDLKFQFHHRCFIAGDVPCRQYNGPYPP